jgi:hypothetical protein
VKLYICSFCDRHMDARANPYDECADCKRGGCEECLAFAEMPGYPLCSRCALAREEQEHATQEGHALGTPETLRETEK